MAKIFRRMLSKYPLNTRLILGVPDFSWDVVPVYICLLKKHVQTPLILG